jgi:hypothetical protein
MVQENLQSTAPGADLPDVSAPGASSVAQSHQALDPRRILAAYKQMLAALFVTTLIVSAVLIALLLPFSFLFNSGNRNPPLIFVVVLAGALGAFFSALIRLYNFEDLPKALILRELEDLPKGHLLIYSLVPAVIGAISATVLYLIFAADLLQEACSRDLGAIWATTNVIFSGRCWTTGTQRKRRITRRHLYGHLWQDSRRGWFLTPCKV